MKKNEELLDQDFQSKLKVVHDKKKHSSTILNDFLQHNSEEVEVVEVSEVEEKIAFLVEVIFSPPIVIKMVTLKFIPFKRKEIPLIQISARKKVKTLKLYFSHVTNLKLVMILHGIWKVVVQII